LGGGGSVFVLSFMSDFLDGGKLFPKSPLAGVGRGRGDDGGLLLGGEGRLSDIQNSGNLGITYLVRRLVKQIPHLSAGKENGSRANHAAVGHPAGRRSPGDASLTTLGRWMVVRYQLMRTPPAMLALLWSSPERPARLRVPVIKGLRPL
jgi:hypothetical protein